MVEQAVEENPPAEETVQQSEPMSVPSTGVTVAAPSSGPSSNPPPKAEEETSKKKEKKKKDKDKN